MSQEEIKPADAKQEEIKTPETIVEKSLTVENIEAQIAYLQAKLGEMKRASEKTIQTETEQIDMSAEKLNVESPEEISTAKKEIGDIETEKRTIAKEATEKIQSEAMEFFIANSEKDVIEEPKKKELPIQEEPVENKEPRKDENKETLVQKMMPIRRQLDGLRLKIGQEKLDKQDSSWHGSTEDRAEIDRLEKEWEPLAEKYDEIEKKPETTSEKKTPSIQDEYEKVVKEAKPLNDSLNDIRGDIYRERMKRKDPSWYGTEEQIKEEERLEKELEPLKVRLDAIDQEKDQLTSSEQVPISNDKQEVPVENEKPTEGRDKLIEVNDKINKIVSEIVNVRKEKKDSSWHGTDEQNQEIDRLRSEKESLQSEQDEIENELEKQQTTLKQEKPDEKEAIIQKILPDHNRLNDLRGKIYHERMDRQDPKWHGSKEDLTEIEQLEKKLEPLQIRLDEIENEKDRLSSKKESVDKDLGVNEKSKADLEKKLGKKFEVRQEAENIMREVKAMRGELDSERGRLVLNSKITEKLRELMMQPGVSPEAGKKWTELYKPIDEIDFNQVQEIIDQYNKADALDKEIDANATKDGEEIESVYGIEPINIDKVLKNNTNPDLKKTREEIKTKLFERVLKNKATEREMIMAEEYVAKAVNAAGGTGFRTVPRVWYENKRLLKAMMKANKQIDEEYVENRLKQK